MPRVHFLNVNDGDCSIIEHISGRVTVIDVSAAKAPAEAVANAAARYRMQESIFKAMREWSKSAGVYGNFGQSEYPDDPIAYMKDRSLNSVFRFISTHPDMDHLDGLKPFFAEFNPQNFWDTANSKELDDFDDGRYDPDDWDFYTSLRDGNPQTNPKRLVLYSGATGPYFNQGEGGQGGGDGLHILAPTSELVADANEAGDWNDASYVILYRTGNKRILFSGDSHDATWKHILDNHNADVAGVDVLIAPHHGRDSDRDHSFLDVVKPRLTLFGNAPSEHLAYDEWNSRDLLFVTNNQAGTVIMEVVDDHLDVYVRHEPFARSFVEERDYDTYYDERNRGWFIGRLK